MPNDSLNPQSTCENCGDSVDYMEAAESISSGMTLCSPWLKQMIADGEFDDDHEDDDDDSEDE